MLRKFNVACCERGSKALRLSVSLTVTISLRSGWSALTLRQSCFLALALLKCIKSALSVNIPETFTLEPTFACVLVVLY